MTTQALLLSLPFIVLHLARSNHVAVNLSTTLLAFFVHDALQEIVSVEVEGRFESLQSEGSLAFVGCCKVVIDPGERCREQVTIPRCATLLGSECGYPTSPPPCGSAIFPFAFRLDFLGMWTLLAGVEAFVGCLVVREPPTALSSGGVKSGTIDEGPALFLNRILTTLN